VTQRTEPGTVPFASCRYRTTKLSEVSDYQPYKIGSTHRCPRTTLHRPSESHVAQLTFIDTYNVRFRVGGPVCPAHLHLPHSHAGPPCRCRAKKARGNDTLRHASCKTGGIIHTRSSNGSMTGSQLIHSPLLDSCHKPSALASHFAHVRAGKDEE
jgi:hypothetical protein